jgi:hypothetical protein
MKQSLVSMHALRSRAHVTKDTVDELNATGALGTGKLRWLPGTGTGAIAPCSPQEAISKNTAARGIVMPPSGAGLRANLLLKMAQVRHVDLSTQPNNSPLERLDS